MLHLGFLCTGRNASFCRTLGSRARVTSFSFNRSKLLYKVTSVFKCSPSGSELFYWIKYSSPCLSNTCIPGVNHNTPVVKVVFYTVTWLTIHGRIIVCQNILCAFSSFTWRSQDSFTWMIQSCMESALYQCALNKRIIFMFRKCIKLCPWSLQIS